MVAGALERGEEGRQRRLPLRRWIAAAVRRQEGRAFLWSPVALTLGIWGYFGLSHEPSRLAAGIAAAVALALLWLGRRLPVVILAGMLVAGFALAKFRSDWCATPLLHATTGEVEVEGWVEKLDRAGPRRATLILAPQSITGIAPSGLPRLVRLSASSGRGLPAVGSRVRLKARLSPNPTPVAPGAFDFGRRLWFEGIGGTGRVTAFVATLAPATALGGGIEAFLHTVREAMNSRIAAALDEPYASFAQALITGERGTIPPEVNRSLLVSGLFHILSISGLHMWLVAGGVFWTVRAALALSPVLAVNWPIRKWAAAAALATGWFYMLVADSGVATLRSFVMIAVMFFAVMVDRPAVSTRNLAIAALVVLAWQPEAAVEAGFQMSFLAVLGLVAFYEAWSAWQARRGESGRDGGSWPLRLLRRMAVASLLSLATTLVAGSMSTLPATYHFGRIAPYSLVANGLAVPVVGLVVMPPALLAAVLMPFGLEGLPLWVMGKGLELVLLISDWVAGFPGAHMVLPQPPAVAVALMALGAVSLCLLQGPVRGLGLPVVALGASLGVIGAAGPDLLVEGTAANVALRDAAGELVPARARGGRFAVAKWLQANGEETTPAAAAARPAWSCTADRCAATLQGRTVVYAGGDGPAPDCTGIDILIAAFPLRGACRAVPLRIDRFDVWRHGAHAVWIGADGVTVTTARQQQGDRPWVVTPQPRARVPSTLARP